MPGITKPSSRRSNSSAPTAGPPNGPLAAAARTEFARHPAGSTARRAAGAVAVALSTTRSVAGAERVLRGYAIRADVRAEALQLLARLDAGTAGAPDTD